MLCGCRVRPNCVVLEALLQAQDQHTAQWMYRSQLLWQLNAQLSAMCGKQYAMPDAFALFGPIKAAASASQIRHALIQGLCAAMPKEV